MKAQEALHEISTMVFRNTDNFEMRISKDCYKNIVNALEKQMPKHIEEQTEEDREFIDYVCPNCKTTLQQKIKGATRTTIFKYKYCHWCGQKLDWGGANG